MRSETWRTFLFTVLIVFSLGCGVFTRFFQGGSALSTQAPKLPPSPKPVDVLKGTPDEQAVYYADKLESPETRWAGWLGLYDVLQIPVIGQDGKPLGSTGDDPIGPRYWQVWYSSGLDKKGRGIPISDAGRVLAAAIPEIDGTALGPALLGDLRLGIKSTDPEIRLFALFVRERIKRGPSHLDIQDPAVTPDQAIIDLSTLQMIAWVAMRGALMTAVRDAAEITPPLREMRYTALLQGQGQSTTVTPCSKILGDSDVTYWTNFILKKVIAKGIQLPGMEKAIPGLVERLLKSLAKGIDAANAAQAVGNIRNALAWLNAVTSALTLAMRLAALEINVHQEPAPLVRTKNTRNGNEGTVTFELSANPKNPTDNPDLNPDGNALDNCLGSFLASLGGITFSLPPAGRISGAELEFEGVAGFPDLVLFANYKDLLGKDTNSNGEVTVEITGVAQKKRIPDDAKRVDKEFSINVSAQPEAYTGKTIVNTFFNGLNFGVRPNPASGISAIVDILKTVHWDLGEYAFALTDWRTAGYRASGQDGPTIYSGVVCSLEKPFSIAGKNSFITYPLKFVPSSDKAGTLSYNTTYQILTMTGSGTYIVEGKEGDNLRIVAQTQSTLSGGGHSSSGGGPAHIDLTPLEGDECN